jgi:glycosidase
MSRPGSGRRSPRRGLALALASALAVAGCGPTAPSPSTSASAGTSASPGVSGSAAAVPTAPPCASPAAQPAGDRPWWSDRVFYEVFVRSFQDSNGDGIGDLRGLIGRLDQLNDGDPATTDDLGVTGLWLMPIAEAASYHGYDVTDYRAVEPDYGTEQDVRDLVAAAHERGIAVVVDEVINHTSIDHPWFQDSMKPGSPHADWYLWSDTKPAVARSDGTPVWHEAPNGRFYYGYFWEGMPDLNLAYPDVTSEIDGIADFWLGDIGVDGFRLDAAKHLIEDGDQLENTPETHEWLATFRDDVHAAHPETLLLGEVFDSTTISSGYVSDGSLDMTFDFDLGSATIISLNSREAGSIAAAQREVAAKYPRDALATFLTNHDQNRVMDQLADDVEAAQVAATLLLTGPGVPFIYYGEEIGMTGRKPDERIRTPMRWDASTPAAGFSTTEPWEPLSDDPTSVNVADESRDDRSLFVAYRALIRLRADSPALASGDLIPVDAADRHVLAYLRSMGPDSVLVVANVGSEAVQSPALSLDAGPLCGPTAMPRLLWSGAGTPSVAAPVLTSTGGLDGYVPVKTLGPREVVVIDLAG